MDGPCVRLWLGVGIPVVLGSLLRISVAPAAEGRQVDYGKVEFKVKPDNTNVYVDQKLIGPVNALDHHRAYMADGNHDIKLVATDGREIERSVYVAAGQTIKIEEKF